MLFEKFGSISSQTSEIWLDGWNYGKKLVIPESKIDAPLTDFPLTIYLNDNNFDFSKAKADGSDIRFTDKNLNQLKFEKVEYNAFLNYNSKLNKYPSDLLLYHGFTNGTLTPDYGSYTLTNSGGTIRGSGYYDSGLSFSNSNGTAQFNSTIIPKGTKTIRVKFKATGLPQTGWGGILLSTSNGATNRQGITINASGSAFPLNLSAVTFSGSGTSSSCIANGVIQQNTWYDIVMTFDGSFTSLYLNGQFLGSGNSITEGDYSTQQNLSIGKEGGYTDNAFTGIIDEIEIYNTVKIPNYAKFNIQLPTVSDLSDTEVYMWYGNSNAYNTSIEAWQDQTGKQLTYNGNVKLVTGVQTGKRVASFDGSGDWFSVPSGINYTNQNFTIEHTVSINSLPTATTGTNSYRVIYCQRSNHMVNESISTAIWKTATSYMLKTWFTYVGTTQYELVNYYAFTTGVTYHIATVREGNYLYHYINGVKQPNSYNIGTNSIYSSTDVLKIGSGNGLDSTVEWNGNMYGARITIGRARYTSNFTPPTSFSIDGTDVVFCTNFDTVYDTSYAMVQHMGDTLVDATGNGNNGTATGTSVVNTSYGKARSFNGTSDYIATTQTLYPANSGTNPQTFLATNYTNTGHVFGSDASSFGHFHFYGYIDPSSFKLGASYYGSAETDYSVTATPDTNLNVLVFSKNSSALWNGYLNGIKLISNITRTATTATNLNIGRRYLNNYYGGTKGEIRVSNIVRSDAWIKAESLALKNDILSYGTDGYEPLGTIEVTGAHTTSVAFNGLNIKSTDEILLVADYNCSWGDALIYATINGNNTLTNYYSQGLTTSGPTISASRTNDALVGKMFTSGYKMFQACRIKITNNGYFVFQSENISPYDPSSSIELNNFYGTSTFTISSITTLTISSNSQSIGVGSKFQLYRVGKGD